VKAGGSGMEPAPAGPAIDPRTHSVGMTQEARRSKLSMEDPVLAKRWGIAASLGVYDSSSFRRRKNTCGRGFLHELDSARVLSHQYDGIRARTIHLTVRHRPAPRKACVEWWAVRKPVVLTAPRWGSRHGDIRMGVKAVPFQFPSVPADSESRSTSRATSQGA